MHRHDDFMPDFMPHVRRSNDSVEKAPTGAGQPILYLDFDGVLHHQAVYWSRSKGPYFEAEQTDNGHVLFQHAPLLVEMLEPYPFIKIVLSTSWVRMYGCYGAAKRLPQALSERVIGATFHSRMIEALFIDAPRGMQVWSDVERRHPKDWLALDDDYLHWPKWCLENYVRTDEVAGISAPLVKAEIERRLERICRHCGHSQLPNL